LLASRKEEGDGEEEERCFCVLVGDMRSSRWCSCCGSFEAVEEEAEEEEGADAEEEEAEAG
jgi:hypothetical protein